LTADHAWGFKDPRTPTTFHAWNAAYPDARWLTLLRRSDEVNAAVEKKMHAVFRFRYECIRQSATLVPRERRMTVFYETLAPFADLMAWELCDFCGLPFDPDTAGRAMSKWKPR